MRQAELERLAEDRKQAREEAAQRAREAGVATARASQLAAEKETLERQPQALFYRLGTREHD